MNVQPQGILPYLGVGAGLLVVFHLLLDRLTPYNDHAVRKAGNKAARITRLGAYLGYVIAMAGSPVMSHPSVGAFALDGAVALVVFASAYYGLDLAILRRINNAAEIERGNVAVAKLEFSAYVGLGIIMNASFAGSGQSMVGGLVSAALFSYVALATLMVVYTVYTIGWSLRGCNLDELVRQGDHEAALEAGSLLLAMSLTLWFSIAGDFTGWASDLKSYGIAAAYNVVAVSVVRTIAGLATWRLGHTRRGAHHGSRTKARIVALVSIGVGLGVGWLTF